MASLSLVRLCSIKYIKTTNQYLCLFPRDVFLSHLPNFISTHKMDLVRTHSRSIADPYQLCDLVCIPLHKAGLEDFATEDIDKAKSWSTARRWYITIATVVLVVNASFASSSPSGCIPSIHEDLHVSEEAAGLTIMLFLLGYCAGPLIFAPLSEFYGEFLRKVSLTNTNANLRPAMGPLQHFLPLRPLQPALCLRAELCYLARRPLSHRHVRWRSSLHRPGRDCRYLGTSSQGKCHGRLRHNDIHRTSARSRRVGISPAGGKLALELLRPSLDGRGLRYTDAHDP